MGETQKFLSLKPKDAESGGGLLDDVDVTIVRSRFGLWDYNGAIPKPIFALGVTFADEEGNKAEQWYSAGNTEFHIPSDDGKRAQAVGKEAKGLHESTNAMLFLASMINSGFPEDKLSDDVSVFEGTKVHVNRVPKPKSNFVGANAGGGKGDGKILVVTKVYEATAAATGGKKAAPKKAAEAPAAAGAAAAPVASGEVATKAADAVLNVLMAKGGSVPKSGLAAEVFKLMAKDPDRNAVVQMAFSDDFLKQDGHPWSYDGTTISMA